MVEQGETPQHGQFGVADESVRLDDVAAAIDALEETVLALAASHGR